MYLIIHSPVSVYNPFYPFFSTTDKITVFYPHKFCFLFPFYHKIGKEATHNDDIFLLNAIQRKFKILIQHICNSSNTKELV